MQSRRFEVEESSLAIVVKGSGDISVSIAGRVILSDVAPDCAARLGAKFLEAVAYSTSQNARALSQAVNSAEGVADRVKDIADELEETSSRFSAMITDG
jgi:hypothetical protein